MAGCCEKSHNTRRLHRMLRVIIYGELKTQLKVDLLELYWSPEENKLSWL